MNAALPAAFYDRPVLDVASDLVGCVLSHGPTAGVIVETEAYHQSEAACHAHIGVTPRTHVLFREPGTAYVYRSYGIHALVNAVCEPAGVGAAVLIRALEPVEGLETMRARRGGVSDTRLCSGPGKLCQALGITRNLDGTMMPGADVVVKWGEGLKKPARVAATVRIGITRAADWPLRFVESGSPWLSRRWPAATSSRVRSRG